MSTTDRTADAARITAPSHATVDRASVPSLIADEAAKTATYTLDDGSEMADKVSTLEGLDEVAARVALARDLRAFANQHAPAGATA